MSGKLMILPSAKLDGIRLVAIPEDLDSPEAFRHVTGVISAVEESDPDYTWEDIEDALDEHGYRTMDFILGPSLD
ncbi:MAG: hypothetical protein GY703_04540 [Gammaproteobacteria bacterium]|nr:hypothetical protein [Gammaproteobacteria bacterium]